MDEWHKEHKGKQCWVQTVCRDGEDGTMDISFFYEDTKKQHKVVKHQSGIKNWTSAPSVSFPRNVFLSLHPSSQGLISLREGHLKNQDLFLWWLWDRGKGRGVRVRNFSHSSRDVYSLLRHWASALLGTEAGTGFSIWLFVRRWKKRQRASSLLWALQISLFPEKGSPPVLGFSIGCNGFFFPRILLSISLGRLAWEISKTQLPSADFISYGGWNWF